MSLVSTILEQSRAFFTEIERTKVDFGVRTLITDIDSLVLLSHCL